MRMLARTLALAGAVLASGCGGSSTTNNPGPTGPSAPPAGGADAVVIDIIGERGVQSFSPNPATVPDGRMVIWRNTDVLVHRVQLNDRSVDTGDIGPGASSAPQPLGGVAKPYHCPLHPAMVGSLNGAATEPPPGPPCEELYCSP